MLKLNTSGRVTLEVTANYPQADGEVEEQKFPAQYTIMDRVKWIERLQKGCPTKTSTSRICR